MLFELKARDESSSIKILLRFLRFPALQWLLEVLYLYQQKQAENESNVQLEIQYTWIIDYILISRWRYWRAGKRVAEAYEVKG